MLGFLKPRSGTITVAGGAPGAARARTAVSYLPEAVAFPKALTGAEVLGYFARLKGEKPAGVRHLLDTVGIADAAQRKVGTYSKGMRQRLGLAQALIGRPELLLLDEPTSGLDPISRRDFYAIIDRISAEGTAVLLSSHSLTEIEARTDRVAILSKGRLVAEGPLAELSRRAALPVVIRVRAAEGDADEVCARLGGQRFNGCSVVLSCSADEKLGLIARASALGERIADIEIATPSLDDVYKFYSDRASTGGAA